MPFGSAEAVPGHTVPPPSAASPTTAYLRLIIKLLLGVFWCAIDNRRGASGRTSRGQSRSLECGFLWQARAPSAAPGSHRQAFYRGRAFAITSVATSV